MGPLLVDVLDARGKSLGVATWAASAPIALRMLWSPSANGGDGAGGHGGGRAGDADRDRTFLLDFVGRALRAAKRRREALALDRDAYRVAHAEADLLPGLIVDRYADAAVIQTTSVAMNAIRSEVAELVARELSVRIVIARDDGSAREFEGLRREAQIVWAAAAGASTKVEYRLGPNRLEADLMTDGKTGGFLDQADNHAAVAALAPSGARALDAFTYHGGFALAVARRGGSTLATDESGAAVARARANASRNGLANLEVRQANAWELLRSLESQRATFDVVVLDPPALAKRNERSTAATRSTRSEHGQPRSVEEARVRAAVRGYKELFMRGARLTVPGGLLVACSCSGRISRDLFEEVVADAIGDAGRSAQIIDRRGPSADHPELAGVPETGYLKCWIVRVL
jgi:23S rRNA (cytosine1962-C5)-methyltransferase